MSRPASEAMTMQDEQRIEQWSIVGRRSLTGNLYDRPGCRDGGAIVTSGVVEIRVVPGAGYALALTESGSVYRLGRPAAGLGVEAAQLFIAAYMRNRSRRAPSVDSLLEADSALDVTDDAPRTRAPRNEATCFSAI